MPMQPAMIAVVFRHALSNVLASWRGQAVVLGFGAVLMGPVVFGAGDGIWLLARFLFGILVGTYLLGASVRAAVAQDEEVDVDGVFAEATASARLLPRLASQVVLAGAPAFACWLVALQLSGVLPLAALALIVLAFPLTILAAPAMLLAAVAVVHGEQEWLPRSSWRVVRERPGPMLLVALVGSVLLFLMSVPLMLTSFVLIALVDPVGTLALSAASIAPIPLLGCGAVALWHECGAPTAAMREAQGVVPPPVQPMIGVEPPAWVDAQAWDLALEPGAVWGTWIRLELPAELALRVAWNAGVPPALALADEQGAWRSPGGVARSGDVLVVQLPAGNTYVQVASGDLAAQAISVTLLVPAAAAA